MDLETALSLIRKTVKNNGTNDTKHIDLGLIPVNEKPAYEKALTVIKLALIEGKLSQEEFQARVHLN